MPPIGQCSICFSTLSSTEAYAIRTCGHTFHDKCIKLWLKEGKCCSSCRQKATEKDVMKLYIQESGMDDTLASQNVAADQLAETERKYEELTDNHKKLVEGKKRLEAENQKSQKLIVQLQKQVENFELLQAQNLSLEFALQNSQATEQKLQDAERKLKASTLYELLVSKGKSEEDFNKFVDSNGSLNGETFLSIVRRENNKLKKQLEETQAAQKNLEKEYEAERKKCLQRKEVIASLTTQVKALQEAAEKKQDPPTPDPRLVNILDHSPPPASRKSLGFSFESPVYPRSVVDSVQPKKKAAKRIIISDDEDDEAQEETVGVSNKKKKPLTKKSKKAFSFSSSDDDEEENIPSDTSRKQITEAFFNVVPVVPKFARQNSSNKNLGSKFGTTLNDKRPAAVPVSKPATKKLTITRRNTAPQPPKVSNAPVESLDDSVVCLDD